MDGDPKMTNPSSPSAPTVKAFHCPRCGGPLTIRGLNQTESIACGSCGSIIDITDEDYKIIATFQSKVKHQPLIPLGTRGKLRGDTFEVIGYLRRKVCVEGVDYEWSEYLLFNPYQGFRWLSEYNGHWNYIRTTTNAPKWQGDFQQKVTYLGEPFFHFQMAEAQVTYVLGEFYWRVQVGETCTVTDYISPPRILSREKASNEVVWSIGEYIEPETLWKSFELKTPIPPRIGTAPNQPSPYASQSPKILRLWGYLLLAAFVIQILFVLFSQNKLVYEKGFTFRSGDKETSHVTEVFELSGRPSNVLIKSTANVDNNWIYLRMALINAETGHAYDFGREISYYYGRDGGESWSEGGRSDEAVLPTVPSGRYYLRIEPESPARSLNYWIEVHRDVPRWSFFFLSLGGLCVFPIFYWWRRRAFEYQRWLEYNYPQNLDQ